MKNSTVADIVTITIIVMIAALLLGGGWFLYRSYRRAMAMASLTALGHAHAVYSGATGPTFHPVIFDPNNPAPMPGPDDPPHTINEASRDPNEAPRY